MNAEKDKILGDEAQTRSRELRRGKARLTAQKVQRLMEARGIVRQAELARRAGIHKNIISTLMTGNNFPSQPSLEAIAKALNVPLSELTDVYVEVENIKRDASMSMTVAEGRPTHAWLTVNRLVRTGTAAKVIQILSEEHDDSAAV